jgi:hypothetical protein
MSIRCTGSRHGRPVSRVQGIRINNLHTGSVIASRRFQLSCTLSLINRAGEDTYNVRVAAT